MLMKIYNLISLSVFSGLFGLSFLFTTGLLYAEGKDKPCAEVFLTGTGGGPAPQFGNAQAGVFVRYGTIGNGCNSVRLQFDAGRGTLLKLSLIPAPTRPGFVIPQNLDALFISHGHIDHTSSLPDILETRWITVKNDGQFNPSPPPQGKYKPLPVICFDVTCDIIRKATAPWQSNEIPGRKKNDYRRTGPDADVRAFETSATPQVVWRDHDVTVSAVKVKHIAGSVGFLVETPAGNICISGDTAISENLIGMCAHAGLIIHDVIHPVINDIVKNPPEADPKFIKVIAGIYKSHASASNFGAMNKIRAVMVLTHIVPPLGAGGFQGIPLIPYLNKEYPNRSSGPISISDFCRAVRDSGYDGIVYVGTDLTKIKLIGDAVTVVPYKDKDTNCENMASL